MDEYSKPMRAGNLQSRHRRSDYLRVETEILRKPVLRNQLTTWLKQNRRVEWIVHEVRTGHGIEITPTDLGAFSIRQGLADRQDCLTDNLIPWAIRLHKHKRMYPYLMLSAEGRLRAGVRQAEETLNRLVLWKFKLNQDDMVIDYRPDTFEVWHQVPRRVGVDHDLIRVPDA